MRHYETDLNDHLSNAVYYQWADQARTEYLLRAGIKRETFLDNGTGPVILEAHMNYFAELRAGEEVQVTCEPQYDEGKTMTVMQRYLKNDRRLAAELRLVMGMFDLQKRRLADDSFGVLRRLARSPHLL